MEYLRKKIERDLKEGDEVTIHTETFIYTGIFHGWIGDRTIFVKPSKISIITGQSQTNSGVVNLNKEYQTCLVNVDNVTAILY